MTIPSEVSRGVVWLGGNGLFRYENGKVQRAGYVPVMIDADAKALETAGACAIVLECVPSALGAATHSGWVIVSRGT